MITFHTPCGPKHQVSSMFDEAGWNYIDDPEKADVIVFTGGADITPFLYGEARHRTTTPNFPRDLREINLIKTMHIHKPKVGICRGGQLLNVLSGGRLWQNVNGHTRNHKILDLRTEEEILATSTHHQMMRPTDDAEILAVANQATEFENDKVKMKSALLSAHDYWTDTEVVWYPNTKSLCFQPHPEYGANNNNPCRTYFFDLIDDYIIPAIKRKN